MRNIKYIEFEVCRNKKYQSKTILTDCLAHEWDVLHVITSEAFTKFKNFDGRAERLLMHELVEMNIYNLCYNKSFLEERRAGFSTKVLQEHMSAFVEA